MFKNITSSQLLSGLGIFLIFYNIYFFSSKNFIHLSCFFLWRSSANLLALSLVALFDLSFDMVFIRVDLLLSLLSSFVSSWVFYLDLWDWKWELILGAIKYSFDFLCYVFI